jgi:hypothetical protein
MSPWIRVLVVLAAALACCSTALGARSQATAISPKFIVDANKLCATINTGFNRTLGKFPFSNFDPTKPDLKTPDHAVA